MSFSSDILKYQLLFISIFIFTVVVEFTSARKSETQESIIDNMGPTEGERETVYNEWRFLFFLIFTCLSSSSSSHVYLLPHLHMFIFFLIFLFFLFYLVFLFFLFYLFFLLFLFYLLFLFFLIFLIFLFFLIFTCLSSCSSSAPSLQISLYPLTLFHI